jgi:hypothetical protein
MQAQQRWDGFLAQIRDRHAAIIVECDTAFVPILQQLTAGGDTGVISRQLSMTNGRLRELEDRIEATFNDKVEAAFESDGASPAMRNAALIQGRRQRLQLEIARDQYEPMVLDRLVRMQYAHAQATQPPLVCAHCRNVMPLPLVGRTMPIRCACGGTTEYVPSALMKMASASGADAVAKVAAQAEWRQMVEAQYMRNEQRPPHSLEVIMHIERTQIAYYRAYWTMRGQFEPERSDVPREIKAIMEPWYVTSAEFEPAWVAAGRPRSPL